MIGKSIVLCCAVLIFVSESSFAGKPVRADAVPAAAVFSVKIDYANGSIVVEGTGFDPGSTTATIAGVALVVDGSSTASILSFPISPEVESAVDELGNYVLSLTSNGENFSLTTFIPFALVTPPTPPPPGPDCPCSTEWDEKSSTASPNGFSGLEPFCSEDSGNFVTVQFYDVPVGNYWVLWTNWNADTNTGNCELYIDGPDRSLDNEDQYNACAGYLRNIITVWGAGSNDCLL